MTKYRTTLNRVAGENFTKKLAFEQDLKEARECVMQRRGETAASGIGQMQRPQRRNKFPKCLNILRDTTISEAQ